MYGTDFKPTLCHYFMRLLEKKGLLTRIYTQNIDDLESKVKISNKLLIQCHGTISKLSCTKCHKQFESVIMKNIINKENIDEYEDKTIINRILERNEIETKEDEDITSLFISHDNSVVYYRNIPYCYGADMCLGIIKPNIVFYGEQLPKRYFWLLPSDMMVCDLLIIMGTSLQVYPCCEIINKINELAIRMLWNNNVIGPFTQNIKTNYRDVVCIDNIDDIVEKFCKEMRWTKELYRIKQKFEETSGYFSEFIRYFSPKEKEEKGK